MCSHIFHSGLSWAQPGAQHLGSMCKGLAADSRLSPAVTAMTRSRRASAPGARMRACFRSGMCDSAMKSRIGCRVFGAESEFAQCTVVSACQCLPLPAVTPLRSSIGSDIGIRHRGRDFECMCVFRLRRMWDEWGSPLSADICVDWAREWAIYVLISLI